ncbi:MAG: hypothetical protein FWE32_04880 [Oscillospiraceae bacterium]|nr:hypothetical protein [Oscillospiraceae bacterium]
MIKNTVQNLIESCQLKFDEIDLELQKCSEQKNKLENSLKKATDSISFADSQRKPTLEAEQKALDAHIMRLKGRRECLKLGVGDFDLYGAIDKTILEIQAENQPRIEEIRSLAEELLTKVGELRATEIKAREGIIAELETLRPYTHKVALDGLLHGKRFSHVTRNILPTCSKNSASSFLIREAQKLTGWH